MCFTSEVEPLLDLLDLGATTLVPRDDLGWGPPSVDLAVKDREKKTEDGTQQTESHLMSSNQPLECTHGPITIFLSPK